ncbi:MAG: phage tail tube protein [Ignavibacteriaceae bacterium]|nr:phage tail tube protein [Ignavibacteriaceae bacterium]
MALGLKTQGTEIYLLDDTNSGNEVLKVGNITDIGEFGPQAGDIDVTNMDSTAMEYFSGLADNGTVTIGFNYDPSNTTQQTLTSLVGGANKRFVIACSEADTDVTYTSTFVIPTDRTTFDFQASVQGMPKGASVNDVWRGSISLRVSGAITTQEAA